MGSHEGDFCIQASLDTDSMQVQIRVIKLDAPGWEMISAGVGKALLPSLPHCSPLGLASGQTLPLICLSNYKGSKVSFSVNNSNETHCSAVCFSFLKALCLEVAKNTGYRMQYLLLSFLLLGFWYFKSLLEWVRHPKSAVSLGTKPFLVFDLG